jgi:hypothetical protein
MSSPATRRTSSNSSNHQNKSSSSKTQVKLNAKTNQFLFKYVRCAELAVLSCEDVRIMIAKRAADIIKNDRLSVSRHHRGRCPPGCLKLLDHGDRLVGRGKVSPEAGVVDVLGRAIARPSRDCRSRCAAFGRDLTAQTPRRFPAARQALSPGVRCSPPGLDHAPQGVVIEKKLMR